jgi:SAM-dependent methyltransferase
MFLEACHRQRRFWDNARVYGMNPAITSQHWDKVFRTKAEDKASWFEAIPEASIRLIESAQLPKTAPIIDVGAGLSRLASELIARGYVDVTVLDISAEAVARFIARTGRSTAIKAIVADITTWWPDRRYQLWHDRAVLHFLVSDRDRSAYRKTLLEALSPNGHVIIIAFGRLAPDRCSGLPVRRYDRDDLVSFLGDDFRLVEAGGLDHRTPTGSIQPFVATHFVRKRFGSDA